MKDHSAIDPELLDFLTAMPTYEFSDAVVDKLRAASAAYTAPPASGTGTEVRQVLVPGPSGAPDVPVRLTIPDGEGPFGCILHMHGGGYVLGSASAYETVHRPMAAQLGCIIASVDYRHAPENCFPAAIEDCYAALAWLNSNQSSFDVDLERVGVMGESAGGGLAAALALLARDRGEYPIAFQHLVYPMIDDRTGSTGQINPYAGKVIWTPHNNRYGWRVYLGQEPGGPNTPRYAAAARHDDLAGLPKCFMLTAELDLFVDENLEYAGRLIRAGVSTELHMLPRAFHAFDGHPTAAVAKRAWKLRLESLSRMLAGSI